VVYDVDYTIGDVGIRVGPPVESAPPAQAVLFFGGSFTFGEGLHDTLTLPWQVGSLAGFGVRTHNFGFHGYGPHQMLASLERGNLDAVVGEDSVVGVIYSAIPDHVYRVVGAVPYGRHGPRYVRDGDTVRHAGRFVDDPGPGGLHGLFGSQLRKSDVWRLAGLQKRLATNEGVDLMVAIVAEANRRVRERWPGARFDVLLWEVREGVGRQLFRKLTDAGIAVHCIDGLLPGYADRPSAYVLSPHDGHPNGEANRRIAGYVVSQVLNPRLEAAGQGCS
jgi:hypothetical protein